MSKNITNKINTPLIPTPIIIVMHGHCNNPQMENIFMNFIAGPTIFSSHASIDVSIKRAKGQHVSDGFFGKQPPGRCYFSSLQRLIIFPFCFVPVTMPSLMRCINTSERIHIPAFPADADAMMMSGNHYIDTHWYEELWWCFNHDLA